ncbi:MAG: YciI family protein [Rhodanobacter sp.]
MTRYLISFDHGAMDHIPDEDWGAVGEAVHAVVQEARDAGVFVFAGGCSEEVSVIATDGTVIDAPDNKAYIGGVTIVDVPSREDALQWAAKIAVACRCAQEFREIMPDPAVGN